MIETFAHWRTQFWDRVEKSDGCWTWVGAYADDGYGILSVARGEGKYFHARAHRLSYFLAYGVFDESLFVLHSCDNTQCVNPQHLHLGTQADNMREKCQRGRARGNGHPKTPVVLPTSQVNNIRRRITKRPTWGLAGRNKTMGAIPKITVRIDRGEDWVEMSGDASDNEVPPMCGEGNLRDWLDLTKMYEALHKLNEAVIE